MVQRASASTMQAIERAVGIAAANQFLESMELNTKYIVSHCPSDCTAQCAYPLPQDTPLISVADPSQASSWEWSTGLDRFAPLPAPP